MIGFNRNRLLAIALFLLVVVTIFLLILVRKQSFAYLPTGEIRRGIGFLAMGVLWTSFSLWSRGRWIWAPPWEVEDIDQSRRFKWQSRINAMGHVFMYLYGAGLIAYELIH